MSTGKIFFYLISSFCLVISGCITHANDIIKDKDNGTTKTYAISKDQAWDVARAVFRWEGVELMEEHPKASYILASFGPGSNSWGTIIGAWINQIDQNHVQITVVAKNRVSPSIGTQTTDSDFQKDFSIGVEVVLSGKVLPDRRPGANVSRDR